MDANIQLGEILHARDFICKNVQMNGGRTVRFVVCGQFDRNYGYNSGKGAYSFSLADDYNIQPMEVTSPDLDNTGYRYTFTNSSVEITFDSDNKSWQLSGVMQSAVNGEIRIREISANNLKDLHYLYEEYLFPNLKKVIGEEDEIRLLQNIKDRNLEEEISYFITDLVDVYNQSYLKNKESIERDAEITGYNQSSHRYYVCREDRDFKTDVRDRINLFKAAVISKSISTSNVRGNASMAFLDNINKYEKSLDAIADELLYRAKMPAHSGDFSRASQQSEVSKATKKLYKDYMADKLINEDDRAKIKEFEKKTFTGQISADERKEYDRLTSTMKSKCFEYLRNFDSSFRRLETAGFLEVNANYRRSLNGTKGISNLREYIQDLRRDFESFVDSQSNKIDAQIVLAQNKALESNIGMLTETDLETGELPLGEGRKALANKINRLRDYLSDRTWGSQVKVLIERDARNLRNILFKAEALSSMKDFLLNGIDEELRQQIFGRYYRYLTTEDFFNRIMGLDEGDGSVYDRMNDELAHKVGNIETVKEQIRTALQMDPDVFLTDDKFILDIKRIVQERNALVREYDGMDDSQNQTQKSEIARKIVYIDTKLLTGKLGRNADARAASKDIRAYNALSDLEGQKPVLAQLDAQIGAIDGCDKDIQDVKRKVYDLDKKNINFLNKVFIESQRKSHEATINNLNDKKTQEIRRLSEIRDSLQGKLDDCTEDLLTAQ